MPLDGSLWAKHIQAYASFLEGASADVLVPKAGGDPIPFSSAGIRYETRTTESGLLVDAEMTVMVRTPLVQGADYLWDNRRWRCHSIEKDRVAGSDWPFAFTLYRTAAAAPAGG